MKSAISLTLLACLLAGNPLAAQDHGHFFVFAAPANATSDSPDTTLFHVGGGGEGALGHVWGLGADFGGMAHTSGAGVVTTISANGFYHPLGQHHRRLDPYFIGGYGWFRAHGGGHTLGLPNVGGGVNYWLPEHHNLGLKLEFRTGVPSGQENLSYREVRMGVTIWQ